MTDDVQIRFEVECVTKPDQKIFLLGNGNSLGWWNVPATLNALFSTRPRSS